MITRLKVDYVPNAFRVLLIGKVIVGINCPVESPVDIDIGFTAIFAPVSL
jgi:hypothetical protein